MTEQPDANRLVYSARAIPKRAIDPCGNFGHERRFCGCRPRLRCELTVEQPIIRACRIEDLPAVLRLWELARSEHASTPDRAEDVQRLIRESPGALLVADDGREICGALIAAWDRWRGNLYRLAVAPERRRAGIGLALVRSGEERLRRQGAARVTALVAHEDAAAAAFWDSAGYPTDHAIGRRVRNV
jgi:ribosomal protein S18 acetylase RimI-like enzyme